MRACEQVRTFIAYPRLNVKIVSGLGGFSAGIEGVTHVALEDVGIMRCIPDLVIICPADSVATHLAVREALAHDGPVYIRLGRDTSPVIFDSEYRLKLGKGNLLHDEGNDVALVTSGLVTAQVLEAQKKLGEMGIGCKVVEIHTIKPIDEDLLADVAQQVKCVVTIEEHSIIGGLGSAVAEALSEKQPTLLKRIGVNDCFTQSATPEELVDYYGLSAPKIAETVSRYIKEELPHRA
jgi:transketolase